MITYGAPKRRERPGLLPYLETKLGRSQGRGEERHFDCPFCLDRVGSESDKKKLDVNISKGIAACYRCGWRGTMERLFRDMNGGTLTLEEGALVFAEAEIPIANMKETLLEQLHPVSVAKSKLTAHRLPPEYLSMSDPKNERWVRAGFKYWTEVRGLDPALIAQHKVGYCLSGVWANRLVMPVFQGGRQVYFTTRFCGQHFVKARNPDHIEGYFSKADVVWNYDGVVGKPIIAVCEGVMSAMAFDCGVAILGKTVSPEQIALLAELVPRGLEEVIVALDPDAYAQAEKMYYDLSGLIPTVTILHLDHGDPDDRREDLPRFLEERRPPDLRSKILGRLVSSK